MLGPKLQELIHTMEEGRGARVIIFVTALLAFVALALFYDMRCFKNFSAPEAMDASQVARNIAEGRGYTTRYIRPFSMHLLREHRSDRDPLVTEEHPDLANPPVYPTILAGYMKATPMEHEIDLKKAFSTYEPERWIAGLNQFFFYVAALLVFLLGNKLFDRGVGWIAVLVFVGAEVFWRFSISGLSTMLLLVLFLGFIWCLAALDITQRDQASSMKRVIGLSVLAGVLLGLMALTRYSFLWLIIPTILFVVFFTPRCKVNAGVAIVVTFFVVIAPWIVRNITVSGTPLGVNGYSLFEQLASFQGDTLQRALRPGSMFDDIRLNNIGRKLFVNLHTIITADLPKLGGNWVTAFFLCGLLLPYRNPTLARLRLFLVTSLALFALVQAWGRTGLSDMTPTGHHSENLLIVFAPILFVFGVAFFFVLLDQLQLSAFGVRQGIIVLFLLLTTSPLILTLLPRSHPFSYPPYFPPLVQQMTSWMKDKEMLMSDIPWAVAWYGDRQCSHLTLDYDKEFYTVNDDIKPVSGLYLSPATLDKPFLSQILRPTIKNKKSWERFVFESLSRGEVVAGFPLKKSRLDFLPDHLFLTDWERWKMRGQNQAAPKPKLPDDEENEPTQPIPTMKRSTNQLAPATGVSLDAPKSEEKPTP